MLSNGRHITVMHFSLLFCLFISLSQILSLTILGISVFHTSPLTPTQTRVVLKEMMEEELEKVAFIATNIYEVYTMCQVLSSSIHLFILTMMEI